MMRGDTLKGQLIVALARRTPAFTGSCSARYEDSFSRKLLIALARRSPGWLSPSPPELLARADKKQLSREIGLFAGIVAALDQLSYLHIRLKRLLSKIALKAAYMASYTASLSQRLVPNLEYLAEKLRDRAEMQRELYRRQVAEEDDELAARHTRNQARHYRRRRPE